MLNGIFLVGENKDILLQKEFLSFTTDWRPDAFVGLLKQNKDLSPCLLFKGLYYFHLCCDKIYIVAVTENQTASPIIVCEYMEKLVELFKIFFGTVSSSTILGNIGLAYEIVCETNDAGCPKLLQVSKLKPLLCNAVTTSNNKSSDILDLLPDNLFGIVEKEKHEVSGEASSKPLYNFEKKLSKSCDELYIDLIEKLSVIINTDGSPALCNMQGNLNIKSYLDGDAIVSFSFPESIHLFSQVVYNPEIIKEQSNNLTVSVNPGGVQVLSYSTSDLKKDISLPFTMYINVSPTKCDKMLSLSLKLYCALPIRNPAVNLVGKIPLPRSSLTVTGSSSLKNVTFHFDKEASEFVFKCPIFPGLSHHSICSKIYLSSWTPAITLEMTNVTLQFEVPMFCHSDMRIVELKVNRANTLTNSKPIEKWVRYLTFARSYEFRIGDNWFLL